PVFAWQAGDTPGDGHALGDGERFRVGARGDFDARARVGQVNGSLDGLARRAGDVTSGRIAAVHGEGLRGRDGGHGGDWCEDGDGEGEEEDRVEGEAVKPAADTHARP